MDSEEAAVNDRGSSMRRLIVALALLCGAALRSATKPEASEANVVMLPPMIVAAEKGPVWLYGAAGGREYLSSISPEATASSILRRQKIEAMLADVLPPALQYHTAVNVTLFVERKLAATASQEWVGKMTDAQSKKAIPKFDQYGRQTDLLQNRSLKVAHNMELHDRDTTISFDVVEKSGSSNSTAFTTDYILYLMKNRVPALPRWFIAGFASFAPDLRFTDNSLHLRPMQWISGAQMATAREDRRSTVALAPLDELFAGQMSAGAQEAVVRKFQAQSELFLRWALTADQHAHRAALWRFTERCAQEEPSEAAFRECFGFGYVEAEDRVSAFVATAVEQEIVFPKITQNFQPAGVRPATEVEIARLKGDWERLEYLQVRRIAPDLASNYLNLAQQTLQRGIDRREATSDADMARLFEVCGLCDIATDARDVARENLLRAALADEMRPIAAYQLAQLQLADRLDAILDQATAERVAQQLIRASRRQTLPELYSLLASILLNLPDLTPVQLAPLEEGLRCFPGDSGLCYWAARAFVRVGDRQRAVALINQIVRSPSNETNRLRIAELRSDLGLAPR